MKGANIVVNELRISSLNLLQISKTFAFPLIYEVGLYSLSPMRIDLVTRGA